MSSVVAASEELAATEPRQFPWYDAHWLDSYVSVVHWLREHRPGQRAAFEQAFEVLRTRTDFEVLKLSNVFDEPVQARLRTLCQTLRDEEHEKHEALRFGRSVVHDHPLLTELQATLTERMSELVREEVEPCYNFLSLYNNLGVCQVHMDAPEAKWTLDYCIAQSAVWPIHVSRVRPWPDAAPDHADWAARIVADRDNHFTAYEMQPGEALVFSGSSQWHYRERIPRVLRENHCRLAFFHFRPRGAGLLVKPWRWAELFGIPELAQLVREPRDADPGRLG